MRDDKQVQKNVRKYVFQGLGIGIGLYVLTGEEILSFVIGCAYMAWRCYKDDKEYKDTWGDY